MNPILNHQDRPFEGIDPLSRTFLNLGVPLQIQYFGESRLLEGVWATPFNNAFRLLYLFEPPGTLHLIRLENLVDDQDGALPIAFFRFLKALAFWLEKSEGLIQNVSLTLDPFASWPSEAHRTKLEILMEKMGFQEEQDDQGFPRWRRSMSEAS